MVEGVFIFCELLLGPILELSCLCCFTFFCFYFIALLNLTLLLLSFTFALTEVIMQFQGR